MRFLPLIVLLAVCARAQVSRNVGRLQEVFAWKQITFNINGVQGAQGESDAQRANRRWIFKNQTSPYRWRNSCAEANRICFTKRMNEWFLLVSSTFDSSVLQDRSAEEGLENTRDRSKRQSESDFVFDNNEEQERDWNQNSLNRPTGRPRPAPWTNRPNGPSTTSTTSTTTQSPNDEAGRFFVQYNNLPMGVERVGNRLFVTLPRRRHGIPSTLNYLDLTEDSNMRSPGLRPYPDLRASRSLTSVYRTRADECGRLWMIDTGLLEIPNNRQQVQQPAIVAFDLNRNRQIFRYPLKSTDIISEVTPTGLASITVDIVNGDCTDAYAYIPDLTTYGLIVYSLRENDSWRLSHNYFSFNPTAGNLRIAGQRFQWNDGIFSVTLTEPRMGSCRTAYFHPMVGTTEFSVSTCVLRNRTAAQGDEFWAEFSVVGDRGANSQSNMHGYHEGTRVVFFADIARDAVSCWHTGSPLSPAAVGILAQDSTRISYPSDLHVTGDEVWVMANSLPTWVYSRLDTNQYNFFIYKANVHDLISGTVCSGRPSVGLRPRTGADGDDDAIAPASDGDAQ